MRYEYFTAAFNEFVAGGIGGVTGVLVGYPFDTMKLQLQIRATGDHRMQSMVEAYRSVAAQGLKRGFFRGMSFPFISFSLINGLLFGAYGTTLDKLSNTMNGDDNPTPTNLQIYIAGCTGGIVQLTLACPVEVIKCTMQSQIPWTKAGDDKAKTVRKRVYYKSAWSCAYNICKEEGIRRGLFRGYWPMFIRDVPSFGLYLLAYEYVYHKMLYLGIIHKDDHNILGPIVSGGIAGCLSWLVVMPFDVIKSRLQVDHGGRYRGFFHCMVNSVQYAGVGVLFRGTGITMFRAFPVNAITFLVYSKCLSFLHRVNPPPGEIIEQVD